MTPEGREAQGLRQEEKAVVPKALPMVLVDSQGWNIKSGRKINGVDYNDSFIFLDSIIV